MNRLANVWLIFWSVFYGAGAPSFQWLFIRKNHFVNQFSVADFLFGAAMLVSVLLILMKRRRGQLLNVICWGAFLSTFISALCYFHWFLKEKTPPAAIYVNLLGLAVALTCLVLHLRRGGQTAISP